MNAVKAFLAKAIMDAVKAAFKEWMPIVITALVKALAESSRELVEKGADVITDAIPGELDDQLVDAVLPKVMGYLEGIFGGPRR